MRKRFLALILLLGLTLRLCLVLLQDTNLVIDLLFFDDSFYLLNIARNIAAGNGITHDGLHMTNGFQPLYVATMIPVFWVAGADRIFPIYFAAVFLSACSIVSAYFCFKIVERVCSTKVAFFSLPFTLFSPLALNYSLNGAETSLAILLFLAAAYIYIRDIQYVRLSDCPRKKLILLGILLGLSVLARIDMLIFIFAVAIDTAYFHLRTKGEIWEDFKRSLVVSSAAAIVVAPWLIFNLICFHSLIPLSGKTVSLMAARAKPYMKVASPIHVGQDAEPKRVIAPLKEKVYSSKEFLFYRMIAFEAGRVLEDFAQFPDWINFYWKLAGRHASRLPAIGKYLQLPPRLPTVTLIMLLCLIPLLWYRKKNATDKKEWAEWNIDRSLFLVLFSFTLILAYIIRVPGWWFFARYFAPVYFVAVIFLSLFLFILVDLLSPQKSPIRHAVTTILVLSMLVPWLFSIRKSLENWHNKETLRTYPGIISYVRNNFEKTDTFGAFQSGCFSYFLEQTVHNLDGVVNPKAMEALIQRRTDEYIFNENIDYLIDTTAEMRIAFNLYPGLERRIVFLELDSPSMFSIYRVDHPVNRGSDEK